MPRSSVVDMASVGIRTTHRALSLQHILSHSQFYSTSSHLNALHHLPHLSLRTYSYTLPLLRHLPITSPLYTLPAICQKKKKVQITDSTVKKHKNGVNFYRLYEVCKQFWVNSNMQTKLHFFISRSSPVPLICKFSIFIRSSSCPPIIFAMTRSQKWTQDMAKITILYLHISYHHKADMVLIITFQETSQNFHLYGIWYTDVMRFPFFTLKNLVSHDDDHTLTSQLLPATWK
jgi:hypothetical protein